MKKVKKAAFVEEYVCVYRFENIIPHLNAFGEATDLKMLRSFLGAVFGLRFMKRWNEYAQTIRTQNDRFGLKMKKMAFEKLDPEQQEQLRKLKSASVAAAAKAEGITLETDSQDKAASGNSASTTNGSPL